MPHDHSDHNHAHALLPPDPALRVRALETILTGKGLIAPAALDEIIDAYQNRIGPKNGAQVDQTKAAWEAAYLNTAHGEPVHCDPVPL